MKTERITVLVSKEFKGFLHREAEAEGVNVSELIRRRCEGQPTLEEEMLRELARQLREATVAANRSLDTGLQAVEEARKAIQKLRDGREVVV